MSAIEEELLRDAEEDAQEIAFIRNYLPQDLKDKFTDEELYYFLDVMIDYYTTSDVFEQQADADGYVEIDLEKVAEHVVKKAKAEQQGNYDPEEILFVVQGEMEYANSLPDENF